MTITRINLLPPEIAQKRRARQMLAAAGAAGIALVVLLGLVFVAQEVRLRGERDRLEEQQAANAVLRADAARLSEFSQLEEQVTRRAQLMGGLTQYEVRWSVVLSDISLVIPSNVWLSSFTGTVEAPSATQAATATTFGTVSLRGNTFDHIDVARWLTRLARVSEFLNPYLSLSSRTANEETGETIAAFDSTVRLSPKALRRNQRGAERRV